MGYLRAIGTLTAAAAASVALLVAGGCSCEDSEPVPARVVQQEAPPPPPAPAEQPAAAPPARQVGDSVLRGPGDYLYTATVTAPRHIKKTVADAYISNEIKQFHALEGRYPKSLQELEKWRGEPLKPAPGGAEYSYDPKTGELDLVPAE